MGSIKIENTHDKIEKIALNTGLSKVTVETIIKAYLVELKQDIIMQHQMVIPNIVSVKAEYKENTNLVSIRARIADTLKQKIRDKGKE